MTEQTGRLREALEGCVERGISPRPGLGQRSKPGSKPGSKPAPPRPRIDPAGSR